MLKLPGTLVELRRQKWDNLAEQEKLVEQQKCLVLEEEKINKAIAAIVNEESLEGEAWSSFNIISEEEDMEDLVEEPVDEAELDPQEEEGQRHAEEEEEETQRAELQGEEEEEEGEEKKGPEEWEQLRQAFLVDAKAKEQEALKAISLAEKAFSAPQPELQEAVQRLQDYMSNYGGLMGHTTRVFLGDIR